MSRPLGRMRKRTLALPLVVGLAVTVLTWSGPAGADSAAAPRPGLTEAIETILADPRMDGGAASVVVADAGSGEVLYRHEAGDRLMPASNTKLVTSAAAAELLGTDYRFTTEALADGPRRGSVLQGDLYLRGSGDPTALAEDYRALAAAVADRGVRTVTGGLVADDTRFDSQRLGRSWAADDESSYYSAQISALTVAPDKDYDSGTVIVEVFPGAAAGDRPRVAVTPRTGYVEIVNQAETLPAGQDGTLAVERRHGTNEIVVSGGIAAGDDPAKEWATVWEPTGYAADVFRRALADEGVRVLGRTQLGRKAPQTAQELAVHRSMPLKDLLVPFMKLSNNMHAEALTKAIGYEKSGRGTWSAGLTAISGYLKHAGVDSARMRQVDGSGLSRMNNFPAAQLVELLLSVRQEPWYPDWLRSLPVACDPDRFVGGTLRSRMCGTPAALNARAKTGSLTGASALSGYVKDKDGRELVYAIVLNNYLASSVKSIEDAVVVTLASSDAGGAATIKPLKNRSAEVISDIECSWSKHPGC
ncbi:D-alanyl-D-alanine carboxypeptidase/D-alanyl-D-alanine-endopeptidase [Streptomyces sp. TRM66268-LWL]|uniref:D-alanyl-D-alanine carboxypeptidase/D-alanyl-D-alanine-endopeptidase n=1 Tax=Streptomyces polyasparticus TaxID=2767826 RepID=A0ABR7SUI1_9ACTN|nr:D-alanyl-D-alanine carboxypeptidase/D-alanyl-D-alanine-endopeptidase [Streptomyces polyasparticus]MBC9718196.1 D-alanyl-D-alanine carboxypeptidase/D-alanyl-D-alanine-endopeptidase [Streptomyces polyasparticus]